MNISYNWLKEYLDTALSAEEIVSILTSIGLEVGGVEKVQSIKGGLSGLVIGEILTCKNHENSDHLHVTSVNIGEEIPIQVVCGAPNVAAGQKVVVATVGTILYQGEESLKIKKSKIRGVESFGMICAEDEIGVGKSHQGIMVLPEEVAVGTLAKDYFEIEDDLLIEVDITPNRIDAASHYGVARDLAAYLNTHQIPYQLTKPSVADFQVDNNDLVIGVEVESPRDCPRYSSVTISNVEVKESPTWLKNRLQSIGVRPINNVVDVTNFVLHEMGQALHAFDADVITTGKVHVKKLAKGTKFTTLDGVERTLSEDDLIINNGDEPMCIGGIFGGDKSGVTAHTKNIFLESAYFNPVTIRKSARRHGLNTDASFRFERGCDPHNTIYVLKRAALLIQSLASGQISSDIVDIYPTPIENFALTLNKLKIDRLIGKKIGEDTIKRILSGLEIEIIAETAEDYELVVPAYRVDVQRDVDVIEDILRLYGYNNVELSDKLMSNISYSTYPDSQKLQRKISEQLTTNGFNEVLNNSLTKGEYYTNATKYRADQSVKVMNALSNDLNVMRQTMLFGGVQNIGYNVNRKHKDVKFYEFGNCYSFNQAKKGGENPLSAYTESYHLALWITGNQTATSWVVPAQKSTFFTLKGYVENVLKRVGIATSSVEYIVDNSYDNLLSETLVIRSKCGFDLGYMGVVSPDTIQMVEGGNVEIFYADLYWDNLMKAINKHKVLFKDIAKYPEVQRDLALLVDKSVAFADIEAIAYKTEKRLLKSVSLFDVYEGENLEEGKKSYAVNFVLQDSNETLTDKKIDKIMNKIQMNLEKELNAQLR